MIESIFNEDTLYGLYLIVGYFVITLLLKILKWLCKKTKTTIDDKIINKLIDWHKRNKNRISK